MGALQEGYDVFSTTLGDRERKRDLERSRLKSEMVDRKYKEEQILASQAGTKQTADEYALRKKASEQFNAGFTPPPPTSAPQMESQAVPGNMGPDGPAAGTAGMGAQQGVPAGVSTEMAPLKKWLTANPGLRQQMGNALAAGDGEGVRKVLSMYESSVGGTKDQRTSDAKNYKEARNGGYNGTFMEYQQALRASGASSVSINTKMETEFAKGFARDANTRRTGYIKEGRTAQTALRDYRLMYANVLENGGTGAVADLKLSLRKLAMATGVGEEFMEAITGLDAGSVGAAELIRVQTMNEVFKLISQTKGAISEREMAAFQKSSAGLENTRRGNILIIEMALYKATAAKDRADYISKHSTIEKGSAGVRSAESGWDAHVYETEIEKEQELLARHRLITITSDSQIGFLIENKDHKDFRGLQKAFYEDNGWLPLGMKVGAKWEIDNDG